MSFLTGKNVLLGVTASIAAYKSAYIVRELIKLGANVRVIQTSASKDFITPITLSTLSKNSVLTNFTQEDDEDMWNNHVELGIWADAMIIAPITANTLSKMANGECDNLLLAIYLSARCPVFFAPAMDLDMYNHPTTQKNINQLESFGNILIPPGEGDLASGLVGKGRMAEPEEIINCLMDKLYSNLPLNGKKVLITAGPTYEPIDPIRFIGNYSSGKMGFCLAEAAANKGAQVILVTGPSQEKLKNSNIKRIDVNTAKEMHDACDQYFLDMDISIFSAAVSDYRPKKISLNKIKKQDFDLNIDFELNIDVLEVMSSKKQKNQLLIGFALETDNEEENARLKLEKKNLDLIILNSLNDIGAGFKFDTNKISILDKNNKLYRFELKSKQDVAYDIINHIISIL